jgi:hypothetical protein
MSASDGDDPFPDMSMSKLAKDKTKRIVFELVSPPRGKSIQMNVILEEGDYNYDYPSQNSSTGKLSLKRKKAEDEEYDSSEDDDAGLSKELKAYNGFIRDIVVKFEFVFSYLCF